MLARPARPAQTARTYPPAPLPIREGGNDRPQLVIHHVLLWARCWLAQGAPRLERFGIVRLVQQVCAVPGRVKLTPAGVSRLRFHPEHPAAREVYPRLRPLCPKSQTLGFLGSSLAAGAPNRPGSYGGDRVLDRIDPRVPAP